MGTRGLFGHLLAFSTAVQPVVGSSGAGGRLAFNWQIVGTLNTTGKCTERTLVQKLAQEGGG
jgi:hypothetical protein